MTEFHPIGCDACLQGGGLDFDITMAFQPIINLKHKNIFAYEALVRGTQGETAGEILSQVTADNRYRFDQVCRTRAIELATRLNMTTKLSINFLPNAVYQPQACIQATLAAAKRFGFDPEQLIFEVTEVEHVDDPGHLKNIIEYYKSLGFAVALDDFGSGYSGLNLLADLVPDLLKLDMGLIRNIHTSDPRQAIVRGIMEVAQALNCQLIAEGVEHQAELDILQHLGIELFQGYLFARPERETLPDPVFPR